MKRHIALIGLATLLAFTIAGCRKDASCQLCPGYCDDSGCYACNDDDFCWPVPNSPCDVQQSCSENEHCADWGCTFVCSFDTDCNVGERCLPGGYCGPADDVGVPCTSHDDCGNGMFCHERVCDESCQSDDDCPGDWVCASCGECQPPENPVCGEYQQLCQSSSDCGEGRVCTDLKRCAFECDDTGPLCPHGQICASGVCVDDPAPASAECARSADCDTQTHCDAQECLCVNTYCQSLCSADAHCGWGQFCHLGICKADFRPEGNE